MKQCKQSGETFEITEEDRAFYDKVSPNINDCKFTIPDPQLSPLARAQRRFAHINQLYVYSRKSSATGKQIFSQFPEEVPFPVFENELWWSDSWDALSYGREFDFTRPFFPQFDELSKVVPHFARMVLNIENSDYCNNISACKNCYLVFNTRHGEDCFNCENVWGSRDCLDCSYSASSELCFDCVTCDRCYNVQSSLECQDCQDSYFLLNCRACSNCFGCVNLRRKEYCIYNQQYSKESYFDFINKQNLNSYAERQKLEAKVQEFWQTHPRPHAVSSMVQNVSGNYLFESRNVFDSTLIRSAESLRYCFNLFEKVKDAYDYSAYGHNAELIYESARCGNELFNLLFCYYCFNGCSNLLYCSFCSGCKNCFGCVGLNKKEYCIFNKQYTKEEYQKTVAKIITKMQKTNEWGEFFPMEMSPFPYNHSFAQRYFPKSAEEIEKSNLWFYEKQLAESADCIEPQNLSDRLPDSDTALLTKSVLSKLPFRIPREEIKRLQKFKAPLPRITYDERMTHRASKMEGLKLFERKCAKTNKTILTAFSPDSKWIIWERNEYDQEFSS